MGIFHRVLWMSPPLKQDLLRFPRQRYHLPSTVQYSIVNDIMYCPITMLVLHAGIRTLEGRRYYCKISFVGRRMMAQDFCTSFLHKRVHLFLFWLPYSGRSTVLANPKYHYFSSSYLETKKIKEKGQPQQSQRRSEIASTAVKLCLHNCRQRRRFSS